MVTCGDFPPLVGVLRTAGGSSAAGATGSVIIGQVVAPGTGSVHSDADVLDTLDELDGEELVERRHRGEGGIVHQTGTWHATDTHWFQHGFSRQQREQ